MDVPRIVVRQNLASPGIVRQNHESACSLWASRTKRHEDRRGRHVVYVARLSPKLQRTFWCGVSPNLETAIGEVESPKIRGVLEWW